MIANCEHRGRHKMNVASYIFSSILALTLSGSIAWAQPEQVPAKPSPASSPTSVQTFYLANTGAPQDANEVLTALRNILDPRIKMMLVSSRNAIVIDAPPEQLALARKLLNDLDQPRKTYRLTYALTDMDGTRRLGSEHFAMIVVTGQRTQLKQVSKVPVVTGSYKPDSNVPETQMTYLDIGMIFDATVDEFTNGVKLRSKVEQSSVAEERSGVGPQDPIVRSSSLEGSSFLTLGKPLILGSLDIPGTTRHLDIDVVIEPVQ